MQRATLLLLALAASALAQDPSIPDAAPSEDVGAADATAAPLPVDPALRAALDAAEAAQEERAAVAAPVLSHVIKQAPAAELPSGTGDVDTAGEGTREGAHRAVLGQRARRGPAAGAPIATPAAAKTVLFRSRRARATARPETPDRRPSSPSLSRRLRGRRRRLLRRDRRR